jgi:tight adherence protein B
MTQQMIQLLVLLGIGLGVGYVAMMVLKPIIMGDLARKRRLAEIASGGKGGRKDVKALQKDRRRRQLQEMLNEIESESRRQGKKKRDSLSVRLRRAGLKISVAQFYLFAAAMSVITALIVLVFSRSLPAAVAGLFVGGIGIPLWLLNYLRRRREEKFLHHFPDAIDVLVRSLRAGLPVNDALKVIAREMPEPVGPEFAEVVEGQRLGIPLDQGFQRMHERMPLPEVNFLAIVMAIQSKTGGNLSEALDNLSTVLRDRRKMKLKVKTLSQEAKVSAAIIGALPIIIFAALSILNPEYISHLWDTKTGNLMIVGSLIWMLTGVLVMRKMINFKF